jgi:hypothetical protein
MDRFGHNTAIHFLRCISRPTLYYLLADIDDQADSSLLVRPDGQTQRGIIRSSDPFLVWQSFKIAHAPFLLRSRDILLSGVPRCRHACAHSLDLEVARLINAAGNRYSNLDSHGVPAETEAASFDRYQLAVPNPRIGCDLLLDKARFVLRNTKPGYAGMCGARAT